MVLQVELGEGVNASAFRPNRLIREVTEHRVSCSQDPKSS